MIISLNADWRGRSDPLQWILDRRRTLRKRDTGEEYEDWHVEGFYATLDGAVVGCIEHRLRFMEGEYPPEALSTLCTALDDMKAEIRSALSGFDGRKPGEQP